MKRVYFHMKLLKVLFLYSSVKGGLDCSQSPGNFSPEKKRPVNSLKAVSFLNRYSGVLSIVSIVLLKH